MSWVVILKLSLSYVFKIQVINHIPYIDPYSKRGAVINKVQGEIIVNNIHFAYPLRPDLKVKIRTIRITLLFFRFCKALVSMSSLGRRLHWLERPVWN